MPTQIENFALMPSTFTPAADDTYDLGEVTTPREWKDLHLDGVAYIDEFGQTLLPDTTNAYDIGSVAAAWQDGYFDGVVYIDTITEFGATQGVTIEGVLLKDGYITFLETTLPIGVVVYAGRDNDGDLTLNALTGKVINLTINGTDVVRVSASDVIFFTGDTDDYVKIATVSNIPTIYGTGAYLRIGDAGTTQFTLASEDDLMISGITEAYGGLKVPDDALVILGTTGDIAIVHCSAGVAENTTLTSVLVGTPVTPAIPANSLIISNVTASGDIVMTGNRGGNSESFLWYDASAGVLCLGLDAISDHSLANGDVIIGGELEVNNTFYADGLSYFNNTALMKDNVKLTLGWSHDYWFIYNSAGTQLELWSTDADGGGTDGLVFSVDDGTDDVDFTGGITTADKVVITIPAVAITGEEYGLAISYTGTLSAGDSMVGANIAVVPEGIGGAWVAGIFAKVTQDATKRVDGYISAGEFEINNAADLASAMACLVLNWNNSSNVPGPPGGSTQAYMQLRDYSSGTPVSNLFEFTDASIGTKSNTVLLTTFADGAHISHAIKITVANVPYWLLLSNVQPSTT